MEKPVGKDKVLVPPQQILCGVINYQILSELGCNLWAQFVAFIIMLCCGGFNSGEYSCEYTWILK